MILVDTSVWIDHLRGHEQELEDALKSSKVVTHSMIIGELACGNVSNRVSQLAEWDDLPKADALEDEAVRAHIESKRLMGRGIGFIDAHVLCACLLNDGTLLWSRDKSLRALAMEFGIAFSERT